VLQISRNLSRIAAGIGSSVSGASPPNTRTSRIPSGKRVSTSRSAGLKAQHQLHMGSWK
jgi:hypothetical protein